MQIFVSVWTERVLVKQQADLIHAPIVYVCACSSEDDQKEKSLSHHTIQQLIMEKDQALADLNSVEKSLADLFRRYEKMKDVLEGFRKVSSSYSITRILMLIKGTLGFFTASVCTSCTLNATCH